MSRRWWRGSWLCRFRPGFNRAAAAGFVVCIDSPGGAADERAGGGQISHNTLGSVSNLTNELGSWIWAGKTFDGQTCQLWRSFEIPALATVKLAQLRMTADNEYILFLDGRELGREPSGVSCMTTI